MTMTPVYLLKTPGNSTIEITQDELRSLLGKIEADLHRSKVYCRAMATLQNLLGASAEQAKSLFKAVSREAIGLAFQEFIQQHQPTTEVSVQADVPTDSPNVAAQKSEDLFQCLTSVKLHPQSALVNPSGGNLASESQSSANSAIKAKNTTLQPQRIRWLNQNQKLAKIQQAKQLAAEQRLQSLRQIGQQLRQARTAKGLSLSQLQTYTHVPIHQMEAVENGSLELLPEDVFIRGFIRVMGNALGLNGTALAASLPAVDTAKSVVPSWSKSKNSGPGLGLGLEISPLHLYLGYTALVAGAVGGLSLMSQQANSDRALQPDAENPPPASVSQSTQTPKTITKPGLKSHGAGVIVGPDISPPEAL